MEGLRFGWVIVLFGRYYPGPFMIVISLKYSTQDNEEETVEEVDCGEIGFLDGISSTQETKNSVGLVDVSKSSRSWNST